MTIKIADELLTPLDGPPLTEAAVRLELACRLFDAERIGKGAAGRIAGLTRLQFEQALVDRGLPVVRYTQEMLDQDIAFIREYERDHRALGRE